MKRKMLVTMVVEVSDLSMTERAEQAQGMEIPLSELEGLKDYPDPFVIATDALNRLGAEGLQDILFEGSDNMVKFTDVDVTSATWVK